jgi:hypothetical protein
VVRIGYETVPHCPLPSPLLKTKRVRHTVGAGGVPIPSNKFDSAWCQLTRWLRRPSPVTLRRCHLIETVSTAEDSRTNRYLTFSSLHPTSLLLCLSSLPYCTIAPSSYLHPTCLLLSHSLPLCAQLHRLAYFTPLASSSLTLLHSPHFTAQYHLTVATFILPAFSSLFFLPSLHNSTDITSSYRPPLSHSPPLVAQ